MLLRITLYPMIFLTAISCKMFSFSDEKNAELQASGGETSEQTIDPDASSSEESIGEVSGKSLLDAEASNSSVEVMSSSGNKIDCHTFPEIVNKKCCMESTIECSKCWDEQTKGIESLREWNKTCQNMPMHCNIEILAKDLHCCESDASHCIACRDMTAIIESNLFRVQEQCGGGGN